MGCRMVSTGCKAARGDSSDVGLIPAHSTSEVMAHDAADG